MSDSLSPEQSARANGAYIAVQYLGQRHGRNPIPGGFPQASVVMELGQHFADWILTGDIPTAEESS